MQGDDDRAPVRATDLPDEDRLLENLGRALADLQRERSGARLELGRVDFRRFARRWLDENLQGIRAIVCTAETRARLDHPVYDLIVYMTGLLQQEYAATIAIPLAYYLCKVGAHALCGWGSAAPISGGSDAGSA